MLRPPLISTRTDTLFPYTKLCRSELLCADLIVDLVAEGIDLAIRLGNLKDSTHRAVTVGHYTKWLVASPDFLTLHNVAPKTLDDLESLPFVAMSELARPAFFDFSGPKGRKKSMRFTESFSVTTAPACRRSEKRRERKKLVRT